MKMIGVSGYAFCGKDTFVKIAIDLLKKNGYMPIRLAFADMLKDEVEGMLKDNKFQATVKTDDSVAKALIRPLLVLVGMPTTLRDRRRVVLDQRSGQTDSGSH